METSLSIKELQEQAQELVRMFSSRKYPLDYSINSFEILEALVSDFENQKNKVDAQEYNRRLTNAAVAIGCYMGETFIKCCPGAEWLVEDENPKNVWDVKIEFPNGGIVFPLQRAGKRFVNGEEDGLYGYGIMVAEQAGFEIKPTVARKAWWKFW